MRKPPNMIYIVSQWGHKKRALTALFRTFRNRKYTVSFSCSPSFPSSFERRKTRRDPLLTLLFLLLLQERERKRRKRLRRSSDVLSLTSLSPLFTPRRQSRGERPGEGGGKQCVCERPANFFFERVREAPQSGQPYLKIGACSFWRVRVLWKAYLWGL